MEKLFNLSKNFRDDGYSQTKIQILNRVKIITQMQKVLNDVLPAVFRDYVRVFNFSQHSIILHVINGIASTKIRNLSNRISRNMRLHFKNYSDCQLEIYVQPQTILNYLKINNLNNSNNSNNSNKLNKKTEFCNHKNELFSTQTLNELRSLSQKMSAYPKLQLAIEKVIQDKSQQNLQFS